MIKNVSFRFVLACLPLFFACSKTDEPTSACEAAVTEFTSEASGFFDYFTAINTETGASLVSGNEVTLKVEGDFIRVLDFSINICQIKGYQLDNIGPGRVLIIYL